MFLPTSIENSSVGILRISGGTQKTFGDGSGQAIGVSPREGDPILTELA